MAEVIIGAEIVQRPGSQILLRAGMVDCTADSSEVNGKQDVLKKYKEHFDETIALTNKWIELLQSDVRRVNTAVQEFHEMDENLIEG